jgi:signal transduction histidine kinase
MVFAEPRSGELAAVIVKEGNPDGGIPPENLTKVFESSFSTKPTGKGMRLGPVLARKLMEMHGGRIALTKSGQGGADAELVFRRPC